MFEIWAEFKLLKFQKILITMFQHVNFGEQNKNETLKEKYVTKNHHNDCT